VLPPTLPRDVANHPLLVVASPCRHRRADAV